MPRPPRQPLVTAPCSRLGGGGAHASPMGFKLRLLALLEDHRISLCTFRGTRVVSCGTYLPRTPPAPRRPFPTRCDLHHKAPPSGGNCAVPGEGCSWYGESLRRGERRGGRRRPAQRPSSTSTSPHILPPPRAAVYLWSRTRASASAGDHSPTALLLPVLLCAMEGGSGGPAQLLRGFRLPTSRKAIAFGRSPSRPMDAYGRPAQDV